MCFDVFVCVFGAFMSLVCPISMPAALRRPQKKHAPGILEHVPCVFCRFVLLVSTLLRNSKNKVGVPNQRACGASATSEKNTPAILEHVPCVICRFVFVVVRGID